MSHNPLRMLGDSAELDYAAFVFDHRMIRYFFLAGLAFLIYDHLLTLEAEVKFVWSAKLGPGTCWFFAVRYIALSANIGVAVYYFRDLDHEEALIETTLSIRVFAMYGLNKWILVCLLAAVGVMGSVGLWASVTYGQHANIPAVPGVVGCHALYTATVARSAGTWEALVVCDILVFALTVRRAYIQRDSPLYAGSLIQRMATDGSMYFGIIVLANLANVLTFYLGHGLVPGFLSWFTTSLSVTLLSRLMLNLQETGAPRIATNPVDTETVRFMEMGRTSIDDTLDTETIRLAEMGSTSIYDESRSGTQAT
ncbi:hypothetical protein DFH08DRAFT_964072 [Mycena albidolilacea]|uniref:DUF6533 domain-containing protein n=1 Tax=Mycena albidolilacea TaxID=1033008 RepID=A0AAD6ZTG0_9AGAR|nr:hypothetical protein DFH08DRAFT_964072 [Mycena albidolilacea]